jgi:hypothetical protein
LSYVKAFLPDEALILLATGVTSTTAVKRTSEGLALTSSHRPFSTADMLLWIAQRLDIALNIKIDIKEAYVDVRHFLLVEKKKVSIF